MYAVGNYNGLGDTAQTGEEMAREAATRLHHTVSLILAMESTRVPWDYKNNKPINPNIDVAKIKAVANKVASLRKRLENWLNTYGPPKWHGVMRKIFSPLIGPLELASQWMGFSQSELNKYGPGALTQAKSFENEAVTLCKETQLVTGITVSECKPLAKAPVAYKPPTVLGTFEFLLWMGLAGVAVYYGGKALVAWAEQPKPRRIHA